MNDDDLPSLVTMLIQLRSAVGPGESILGSKYQQIIVALEDRILTRLEAAPVAKDED